VVAQTLCPSRNPKGSSHKGLNRGTVPAQSPELTTCDYFLWGYVKGKVFVPPPPVSSIPDLKNRITAAVETITPDLLSRVLQELDYRWLRIPVRSLLSMGQGFLCVTTLRAVCSCVRTVVEGGSSDLLEFHLLFAFLTVNDISNNNRTTRSFAFRIPNFALTDWWSYLWTVPCWFFQVPCMSVFSPQKM